MIKRMLNVPMHRGFSYEILIRCIYVSFETKIFLKLGWLLP